MSSGEACGGTFSGKLLLLEGSFGHEATGLPMEVLYLIEQGLLLLGSRLTNDLSGNTQDERIRRDLSAGRDQAAGADQ